MPRKTARERYLLQFGMELSLLSTGDGWSYEWKDPNTGRTIAQGRSRGTKRMSLTASCSPSRGGKGVVMTYLPFFSINFVSIARIIANTLNLEG